MDQLNKNKIEKTHTMKIKTLIRRLQKLNPENEVEFQDYNWNDYEFELSKGFNGQAVFVVSPIEDEETE